MLRQPGPRVRTRPSQPSSSPGALALPAGLPRAETTGRVHARFNSTAGSERPMASGDPPRPRRARPIALRWAGLSRRWPSHALCKVCTDWLAFWAQVRASYWVWAEREPPRPLRRLQVSACAAPPASSGARARVSSRGRWPSARLRSLSSLLRPLRRGAAKALREGVASPPAARPVPPLVSPREGPPSGALREDSSRGRPSAGAFEETPGRSHVQSPSATHSLPALRRPPRGPASA